MDISKLAAAFADVPFADRDAHALGYSTEELDKLVEREVLFSAFKSRTQAPAAVVARADEKVYCFRCNGVTAPENDPLSGLKQLVEFYDKPEEWERDYTIFVCQKLRDDFVDEDFDNRKKYRGKFTGTYSQAQKRLQELREQIAKEHRIPISELWGDIT